MDLICNDVNMKSFVGDALTLWCCVEMELISLNTPFQSIFYITLEAIHFLFTMNPSMFGRGAVKPSTDYFSIFLVLGVCVGIFDRVFFLS